MSPATIIVAIVVIIAVAYFIHHIRGLFTGNSIRKGAVASRQLLSSC